MHAASGGIGFDRDLVTSYLALHEEWGVDAVFGSPTPRRDQVERNRPQARLLGDCRRLDDIREALVEFEGCALKRTANKLCFGDGNPDAKIVLIGEAPGAEEDRRGLPFVGPSGQLLDRMLASIGLDRTQVWITNLIFWRPPGNRTPTVDEVEACRPFLERQIEVLEPKVLLFLGGAAAKALLGVNEGVMRMRGRRARYRYGAGKSAESLVTFHPAFLLRQPVQKKLAWRDFMTLRTMIDEHAREFGHEG